MSGPLRDAVLHLPLQEPSLRSLQPSALGTRGQLLGVKDRPRCFLSRLLGAGGVEEKADRGGRDERAVKGQEQRCERARSQGRKARVCRW